MTNIWIDYSITGLEIRTSVICNIKSFPNNTILSCIFLFFFIINLYFLIPAVIAQIFLPTTELVKPKRRQTNEANTETETQPLPVETKISKFST